MQQRVAEGKEPAQEEIKAVAERCAAEKGDLIRAAMIAGDSAHQLAEREQAAHNSNKTMRSEPDRYYVMLRSSSRPLPLAPRSKLTRRRRATPSSLPGNAKLNQDTGISSCERKTGYGEPTRRPRRRLPSVRRPGKGLNACCINNGRRRSMSAP